MEQRKPRRRVAKFTEKAQALIDNAEWPEGVKVMVEGQSQSDTIHVYTPGGGARTFWQLDAYDLTSADPKRVRATAVRRLITAGHDPKYSDKSRAEDLALAALLRGPAQPVFTIRPTQTGDRVDGFVVMVNGHDLIGVYPSIEVSGAEIAPWSLGYWDAESGEWVDADPEGDFSAQLVKYLAIPDSEPKR